MPPAAESGSSVAQRGRRITTGDAGSAAKDTGGGTSDAGVDESGSSSSSAGAFGGGGSVDGDDRLAQDVWQSPGGGGDGSGNPLNSLMGGSVDFDEHSNGPKTDVSTGEHGLLPDVVAAVGSGVDAKGGSVALGGSSSMGMADKINASSESTTITAAASNICRRGTRSSSGPPGEPARDDGLVEGGRKAVTISDLGSSTGTPSGVSTTSLGDEIKASSESTNINAPGRRGSRRSSGLKAVDDSGSGGGSFNNLGGAKGSWHV